MYDYKGHRCVVLNTFKDSNSVLIGLATTNPGPDLIKLCRELSMVSEKGKPQYLTLILLPLDELCENVEFISKKEQFITEFVSCISKEILFCHENNIFLPVRIYSEVNTMTLFEQLDYLKEQQKLLLNNSNFNGAFTKDNLELFNILRSKQDQE
jgi:hypothetical protein